MPVICQSDSLNALPRSLLLYNFGSSTQKKDPDYHPHLLVGLADGKVVSFTFRDRELDDQQTFSLGDLPVSLNPCQVENRKAIFAYGSRSSILFWERETIQHSPVILKVCSTISILFTWHLITACLGRCRCLPIEHN